LEETFEQFHAIEPTADISIKNGDGVVRVYGSRTNDMRVQAIKRAYTSKRLKQIVVDVSVRPGSVSIETSFPPKPTWGLLDRSGTIEYTIVVPQTANISRAAAFHLIAETPHGKIANDFVKRDERRAEVISNLDTLVHDGGEAVIKLQAAEGNIKVVGTNP
jgi:hypothetical protein